MATAQYSHHGALTLGGSVFKVTDVTKNKGGKYLHHGRMESGELHVDETVESAVCEKRRGAIMRAHSATHLLQSALIEVLGDHVHQAGSLVEPDRLRFDFTHFAPMTAEEIARVEEIVNEDVLSGYPISIREMPIAQARAEGATALFGEKYGDTVRVVAMGGVSKELCGGTHLDNTAKVGVFGIVSEFSVASGVRRIEAVTGREYIRRANESRDLIEHVAETLRSSPAEIVHRASGVLGELRDARRRMEQLEDKLRSGEIDSYLASARQVGELKVLTAVRPGAGADDLRRMGDVIRDKGPNAVAVLASVGEGDKITFLAVCGKNAVEKGVKAGDVIRQVTAICGGSGGGKPDSAMGGGKDPLMLDNALAMVDNFVAIKLGLIGGDKQ